MKIWIALFVLFLGGAGVAGGIILDRKVLAQPPAPDSRWQRGTAMSITKFSQELGLTDEQKARVQSDLEATAKEIEAKEKELHELRSKAKEKILSGLSDEQRKKLDELVSKERTDRGQRDIEKRVTTYKTLLGLTDEQATALRTAFQETSQKRHEHFVASHPGGDFSKMREFMAQLQKEQDEKVQKVLTADQFEKYRLVESLNDWR